MTYKLHLEDKRTFARRGQLQLKHGTVETPVFMPVGTYGAVRGIPSFELETLAPEIMLANTYHMFDRPGVDVIQKVGGLHSFMGWNKPILTDSGGFQVFSLTSHRELDDDGVTFRVPRDGSIKRLTPEIVVDAEQKFGSDIMMVLDECPPAHATEEQVLGAVNRTTAWARRSLEAWTDSSLNLFPIMQGGSFLELRKKSLADLMALESIKSWPGLAIGGLSVGEEKKDFVNTLFSLRSFLPTEKPRYLMGVGSPRDLVFAVACGVDMFDCVIPSRNGRHGIAMTFEGRMNLFNAKYIEDTRPIDENCECQVCKTTSRAFIRHQMNIGHTLGMQMITHHNIRYFLDLMKKVRAHIENGTFADFAAVFLHDERNILLGREKSFMDYPVEYKSALAS